ncbi:hypothetical protein Cni_G22041 [Canna indica]|uniref:Uncharacterized protein n=1 Tax=Canna indica TaxID=4628 RepID=A0AAQ3KQN8_9LILI|nr:hypothetical protein Cni_G22041 [Canna indica]
MRAEQLRRDVEIVPKVVLDLEFSDLMMPNEIHSLVQQLMEVADHVLLCSKREMCITNSSLVDH